MVTFMDKEHMLCVVCLVQTYIQLECRVMSKISVCTITFRYIIISCRNRQVYWAPWRGKNLSAIWFQWRPCHVLLLIIRWFQKLELCFTKVTFCVAAFVCRAQTLHKVHCMKWRSCLTNVSPLQQHVWVFFKSMWAGHLLLTDYSFNF